MWIKASEYMPPECKLVACIGEIDIITADEKYECDAFDVLFLMFRFVYTGAVSYKDSSCEKEAEYDLSACRILEIAPSCVYLKYKCSINHEEQLKKDRIYLDSHWMEDIRPILSDGEPFVFYNGNITHWIPLSIPEKEISDE